LDLRCSPRVGRHWLCPLCRQIEPDIAEVAKLRGLAGKKPEPSTHLRGGSEETIDEVAQAVGLGSGDTYKRKKKALAAIEPDIAEVAKAAAARAWRYGSRSAVPKHSHAIAWKC